MKKFDITALGEILIDMTYAGKSESGQTLFEQNPGGAPANVLSAVSRLGGECAFLGKVGSDMHGRFLLETLEKEHICTDGVIMDESYFTTLAFVNLDEKGERSFSFARKPGADTQLSKDEVRLDIIENSKIFHVGSLSLTDEPSKSATFAALNHAKEKGIIISYDPNYRKPLWKSEEDAKEGMRSVLEYVDIIKISDEEIEMLTGFNDEKKASRALLDLGIKIVIITLGEKGAFVRTKDGYVYAETKKVKVVDTTGAGDAFMGGFLYKISQHGKLDFSMDEIQSFATFANNVAGYSVQHRGAINSMPYMSHLENKFLAVGVDWKKGEWIAVAINEKGVESQVFKTIDQLCEFYENADVILIDVPIGLPETETEALLRPDNEARRFLKEPKRKSSVFNTPLRQIVYEDDSVVAWELKKKLNAKISKQSIGICKCIKQADEFISKNPQWKERLLESHPECAFQGLNNNRGLIYSKHTPEGIKERMNILKGYSRNVESILDDYKEKEKSDVLDAFCLAITGMEGIKKGFVTLPEEVKNDSRNIPMKISVFIGDSEDI